MTDVPAAPPEDIVPSWLAWIILLLIVAVVGLGGFAIRYALTPSDSETETPDVGAASAVEPSVTDLLAAVQAHPGDRAARLRLASAYRDQGQYDRALAQYEEVLTRTPKDVAALYGRGAMYMKLDRAREGEVALWDALEIDATYVPAATDLGRYYASRGHYRSLIEAVRAAVEAKPSSADLQYLMGLAYEKLGDAQRSRSAYVQALRYAPHMAEAKDGLDRLTGSGQ